MISIAQKCTRRRSSTSGLSLVETLVYIGILTLILGVVVALLSGLGGSQRRLKASKQVENSAIFGFERMIREIRRAKSINPASVLGTNPGVLVLDTTDLGGAPRTVEFSVSGSILRVKESGIDLGPLTPSQARVTSLVFSLLSTPNSAALKVEMTVEAGSGPSLASRNFYGTAILRNSY
ncbi:hypothetical protein EPN83_01225 [Patescibacteria group bacterium]|nr:MAG: hypothetical protein EPN83_01225 [Patescibacteria group bacterium]